MQSIATTRDFIFQGIQSKHTAALFQSKQVVVHIPPHQTHTPPPTSTANNLSHA